MFAYLYGIDGAAAMTGGEKESVYGYEKRRLLNKKHGVEWEIFPDPGYYDMWAVRPVGDKSLSSPRLFHFDSSIDALKFKTLVEKSNHAIISDNEARQLELPLEDI
jgi:hypothetical protein